MFECSFERKAQPFFIGNVVLMVATVIHKKVVSSLKALMSNRWVRFPTFNENEVNKNVLVHRGWKLQ